jgi:hypothetical protein
MINYNIGGVYWQGDMETNVGGRDRTARLIIGVLGLLVGGGILLGLVDHGPTIGAIAVIIGLGLLVSGITRKCPLNRVLGINTAK